jgi:hypothetical protein
VPQSSLREDAVIVYKTALKVEAVLAALDAARSR